MTGTRKKAGPKLSKNEKDQRDARAQKWMNNRKIERVWAACVRWRETHDG